MLTLGEVLDRAAIAFPNKEVICFLKKDEERITYSELNDRVNRLAGGLVKLGIKAGDKVAIWMPNRPEWIVTFFAVARIGAVLVPMDTWYKTSEVEYILDHSDSVAVITSAKFGKKLSPHRNTIEPGIWTYSPLISYIMHGTSLCDKARRMCFAR